jgi:hypothetical protein
MNKTMINNNNINTGELYSLADPNLIFPVSYNETKSQPWGYLEDRVKLLMLGIDKQTKVMFIKHDTCARDVNICYIFLYKNILFYTSLDNIIQND